MVLPQTGAVLDIGCGYGAVGITAAALNPKLHVMMTDVNMRAVRLANRTSRVTASATHRSHMVTSMNPLRQCVLTACCLIRL